MAWEDLEQDIAEEFGDQRLGWVDSGFSVFRRPVRPARPPSQAHRESDAAYQQKKRARRRELWIAVGRLSIRCERPECCNLLKPMKRGAPQQFCSPECKDWTPPKPKVVRRCSQCPATFETHGRRTTCSNACRQRAWYSRNAGAQEKGGPAARGREASGGT